VITETLTQTFQQVRQQTHPRCVVCSQQNSQGLKLDFHPAANGAVEAEFTFDTLFEGYPNMLHGGVICAILDGAMTNCLFSHDCIAVTADLHVRFRHPVATNHSACVHAWISRSTTSLYEVKAKLIQDEQLKVTATGKFMRKPHLHGKGTHD